MFNQTKRNFIEAFMRKKLNLDHANDHHCKFYSKSTSGGNYTTPVKENPNSLTEPFISLTLVKTKLMKQRQTSIYPMLVNLVQ